MYGDFSNDEFRKLISALDIAEYELISFTPKYVKGSDGSSRYWDGSFQLTISKKQKQKEE